MQETCTRMSLKLIRKEGRKNSKDFRKQPSFDDWKVEQFCFQSFFLGLDGFWNTKSYWISTNSFPFARLSISFALDWWIIISQTNNLFHFLFHQKKKIRIWNIFTSLYCFLDVNDSNNNNYYYYHYNNPLENRFEWVLIDWREKTVLKFIVFISTNYLHHWLINRVFLLASHPPHPYSKHPLVNLMNGNNGNNDCWEWRMIPFLFSLYSSMMEEWKR